jgi:hypothetical protein
VTIEPAEVNDKLEAAATTFLPPARPTNFSPGNVATPALAFLTSVPVSSEDEPAREIEGVPVVTRF